jgi:hypothetical protein
MRTLLSVTLAALLSSCNLGAPSKDNPRIVVVDHSGNPVSGAVVLPENEDARDSRENLTEYEIAARTSDAAGMIRASLDDYYWESDSCYHFRVRRAGFESFEIAVSKELMPPVLRIELRERSAPAR